MRKVPILNAATADRIEAYHQPLEVGTPIVSASCLKIKRRICTNGNHENYGPGVPGVGRCHRQRLLRPPGVYEETPKAETSIRFVTLPLETMKLLRKYRTWQNEERLRLGEYYQYHGFVFSQDNGQPMHPDSVKRWLNKFSVRHDLSHINPHAFWHTMASMLYFNGGDSVSISKRLGHAQVSTMANIYAHVMEEADQRNADILADIFLKRLEF